MRSNGLILFSGILFILLTDTLLFLLLKKHLSTRLRILLYWLHSLALIGGLVVYQLYVPRLKGPSNYYWIELAIGILFLFYGPKLLYILLSFLSWIIGRFHRPLQRIGKVIAAITAFILFLILLYSITYNRSNYKIEQTRICFPQLPSAFNNLKIVQLTDLHLGSYSSHYTGIAKLVDKVNRLHPDLILFTGDMVNNFASEMIPWIPELSRLQAKYGKFAVTGNHDYGDYSQWPSAKAKQQNMDQFYRNLKAMGFRILNNQNIPLTKNNDTLYIAGVANWGKPPFPQYGNITQALNDTKNHFVILLSHDPSYWKAEILNNPVPLTLSGHTHAMQLGIKLGKLKWSPARYIYPEYDGLYQSQQKYLYVSRGVGYLGFPGRIGLRPQIEEIILYNNYK